jgi:DNA invertase Pin-like site-specific DNA recombinase
MGVEMPAKSKTGDGAAPAAQYLRMSREHQRYSIRNQARAIAEFATERGYEVVRTYTDPGRSGLTLTGRPGLRSLLADAISKDRAFDAVLVLDVSRWGRFQDLDQSAHYEFICREAGVRVVYCAEPFENDGSPTTMLLKQIKRLMAAEYSRELSGKVLRAQLLQAQLGHKQGGPRPYGFRRVVVDHKGRERLTLETGQWKALSDQRVVYAHGPEHELAVIRDIFRMYTQGRLSVRALAAKLNETGAPSKEGGPWTVDRVKRVLKNELVLGFYVFNRTSRTLKGAMRHNPPESWIRTRVLEPIISRSTFELARRRLAIRRHDVADDEVLRAVGRLLRTHGFLNEQLINGCAYTPSAVALRRRFGSIPRLYELVGYSPTGRWRPAGQIGPASDAQLLKLLRSLADQHGYISQKLVTTDPSVPSASTYQLRFGSLTRAYELAALPYSPTELQRGGHERHRARQTGTAAPTHTTPRWPPLPVVYSDEDLIGCLRRLNEANGYVTAEVIKADAGSPGVMVFIQRFGSLLAAYERAGLPCTRTEIWGRAQRHRQTVRAATS